MKTVRAKGIVTAAEKLFEIQRKQRRLNEQLRKLKEDEAFYIALLERRTGAEDFQFAGNKYMKSVEFKEHDRRILDQRKAIQLLGDRAPYQTIKIKSVKVDYVYE